MSTVKITDLPTITNLDANTGNTILVGVDLSSDVTGRISATVLADGLYENKALKVGLPDIIFPNVIAQFAGSGDPYLQINAQNIDSNNSIDYVGTADIGTNANNFIDMGINNSLYQDEEFSAQSALDGYLYVHGSVNSSSDGNLIIGTASAGANVVFAVGGQRSANVVATLSRYGLSMNGASYIKFSDNSIQSVAAAPANYTQSAFDAANTVAANVIIIQGVNDTQNTKLNSIETVNTNQNTSISIIEGVNLTQNTNITTANNHAWAAFDKANNALANTTGTFAGDLTITGNTFAQAMNTANLQVVGTANVSGTLNVVGAVSMNATLVLANNTFSASEAAFRITAAGSSQTPTQAGTLIQLTSKPNVPARVLIDSFGTSNTAYPIIAGRNARGTVDTPTPTQNNDILLRIAGNSYGTTGYAPFGDARIDFVATENHSDTARGSRIRFWNTPNGSNVVNEIASFNADSVYFTGTVAPEKGFIYTPTMYQGAQTAITIDFATTSLIKADLTADLTFTLTNYQYGKVVEVWLVNTGGTQRTITHGCTATNSTTNSTTFNMAATSSAYLRYFSINGDNANTFVAVQYS